MCYSASGLGLNTYMHKQQISFAVFDTTSRMLEIPFGIA